MNKTMDLTQQANEKPEISFQSLLKSSSITGTLSGKTQPGVCLLSPRMVNDYVTPISEPSKRNKAHGKTKRITVYSVE